MSVRRFKDPAGLLPDAVNIDLDGAPDDWAALEEILEGATPEARVARLREHPEMASRADKLAAKLKKTGGNADDRMLMMIAQAEYHALYLRAAPVAKTGRKVRLPFSAANAARAQDAEEKRKRWQQLAEAKWAQPQHQSKGPAEIARLIAGPGEKPDTIRRRIKKPS